jgi:hypothetical protein
MGVVSGYPNEYKEIYTMREIAQGQVTSDDIQENLIVTQNRKIYHLDETNQLVATNSGVVKALIFGMPWRSSRKIRSDQR